MSTPPEQESDLHAEIVQLRAENERLRSLKEIERLRRENAVIAKSLRVTSRQSRIAPLIDPARGTFSLRGRSNRSTYLVATLVVLGCWTVLLVGVSLFSLPASDKLPTLLIAGVVVGLLVVGVPLSWFGFVQNVRRLHDLGLSGWWSVAAIGAFAVAAIVSAAAYDPLVSRQCFGVLSIAWGICLHVLPGDAQPNRFGLPPQRGVWISNEARSLDAPTIA